MRSLKIYFIVFITINAFIFNSVKAQRISKNDLKSFDKANEEKPLLKDGDADFKITEAPTKWANESGVILAHKTTFFFDKKGASVGKKIGRGLVAVLWALPTFGTSLAFLQGMPNKILVEETERRKILLQDKFSIEQYSFLYFRIFGNDAFAARVIKKNGDIEKVNFTDAAYVKSMAEVPENFKGYTDGRSGAYAGKGYCKVAIPNLQEGDIIEYEFAHENDQQYLGNVNYQEFEPVYFLCNRELPVVKQVIEVTTDSKNFIGYRPLKGSPGFNKPSINGDFKTYKWEDGNREKLKDTRYLNEFVELPSIKFQVIYASNRKQDFIWFKDADALNHAVTPDELTEKAKQFWYGFETLDNTGAYTVTKADKYTSKEMYKDLKTKGVTEMGNDDYIKNVYYLIRSHTVWDEWTDFTFARMMASMLERKNIPYEVVVSTSNFRTSISDIAFNREIIWGIKVGNKYYFNPYDHGNPGELSSALSGNAAILFAADQKSKEKAKTIVLPASDTTANLMLTTISSSLDDTQTGIAVKKEVEINGLNKEATIDNILENTTFMESDPKNYGGASLWENLPAKEQEKKETDWATKKKEWKEEKPKQMKAFAEGEYGFPLKKYDNFKLLQDGRSLRKQAIKYNEEFTIDETVSKAGDDMIVALPALITQQVKIKKDERERVAPINFINPKTYHWKINFTIPAGYTAVGLDALNQHIRNNCGSFVSTATANGNSVAIDVTKIYNAKYFEATDWSNILAFLDAAFKFSQAKIILKKS